MSEGAPIAFTRGGLMRSPILTVSALMNRKIDLALKMLEIPENIFGNEDNERLIEDLKS